MISILLSLLALALSVWSVVQAHKAGRAIRRGPGNQLHKK